MSKHKIIELVCSGNVLDDRGVWVPIAVQVKKEREFLTHLENGEVLVGGVWKKLSVSSGRPDIAPQVPLKKHPISNALPIETPEETIDLSVEQIYAAVKGAPVLESDFPPETAVLKIDTHQERLGASPKPALGRMSTFDYDGNTQVDMVLPHAAREATDQEPVVTTETQYEETVLFSIKTIQAQIDAKNRKDKGLQT